MSDERIFRISGMDDNVRESFKTSHPINTIITYECSGMTDKGVPRFGRYIRIRDDVVIKESDDDSNIKENVLKILQKFAENEKINGESFKHISYMRAVKAIKTMDQILLLRTYRN